MKKMPKVRFAMMFMFSVAGVIASRDALATSECTDPQGGYNTPFAANSLLTNPSVDYCTVSYTMTTGPGAALLGQDVSAAAGGTFGIEGTSINNSGVYGLSEGFGTGVYGNSTSGIGVFGTTAGMYETGVWARAALKVRVEIR
jgi:hypothetical protein